MAIYFRFFILIQQSFFLALNQLSERCILSNKLKVNKKDYQNSYREVVVIIPVWLMENIKFNKESQSEFIRSLETNSAQYVTSALFL